MSKALFYISNELQQLVQMLEESGGEFTPDQEQALQLSQQELAEKAQSYIHVLTQLKADVKMAEEYEKAAKAFKEKKKKIIDRLENALLDAVLKFGPITTGIHTINTRRSESVEITDLNTVPAKYKVVKMNAVPDKKAIKEAIYQGHAVPGAYIQTNENLAIK